MEIRSSTNYLWYIKDVLGQGATGAVYKGRNRVFIDYTCYRNIELLVVRSKGFVFICVENWR